MNNTEIPVITPQEVKTIYKNKKTGETYETREGWVSKGIPNEDIQQDVTVVLPKLDLFAKT
mgnify:CR=1 FL=1|jgi:hypothetical protein